MIEKYKEEIKKWVSNWEVVDDSNIRSYSERFSANNAGGPCEVEYFYEDDYSEQQTQECIDAIEEDTAIQYFDSINKDYDLKCGNNYENEDAADDWLAEIDKAIIKYIEEL